MSPSWAAFATIALAAALPVAATALFLSLPIRILPRGVTRRAVRCPLRQRDATVDFVVDGDGADARRDVVGCSLAAPGHEIRCGKPCRSTGVAPFGTAVLAR